MDNKNILLGLTCEKRFLRFIEAETGKPIGLISAGEVMLDAPFDYSTISDSDSVIYFSSAIKSLIDRVGISAQQVSFALDRRMVLFKRLKVDQSLSESELRQHIEWELEQLLIAPRDEYNVTFERLGEEREHSNYVMVAAVRKSIIGFLKDVFGRTSLQLKSVDLESLSTIRGLLASVDEKRKGIAAVIDANEIRIDCTLLKDGAYLISSEMLVKPETSLIHVKREYAEELAGTVNDELLRLLDTMGDEVLLKNIETIYICNRQISMDIVASLQQLQRTADIIFIDPLTKIQHSLNLEAENEIKENPGKYLSVLGLIY